MSISILSIYVAAIIAIAYFVGRLFDDVLKTLGVWVVAGLLITIGIVVFVNGQSKKAQEGWLKQYNVEELP